MQPLIPFYEVPVIHIGPLPIHGFGILVALGFIIGGNVAMKRAKQTGLDPEAINKLLSWLVVGTFLGGHIGYGLMYHPKEYFENPVEFLKVWQGLSSFGGFLVCVPLSFWFFKKYKLPVWPYMDSLAIGLSMGWFLGRMGCTVAHDHPGTPSNFWLAKYCRPVEGHTLALPDFMTANTGAHDIRWGPCAKEAGGFVATVADKVPVDFQGVIAAHDMGFYEALWSLGVFLLFIFLDRWARKPGFYVCMLGVLYGPARFAMDYLRPASTDVRYLDFTPGQWWSVVFFAVSLWGLVVRMRSSDEAIGRMKPMDPAAAGRMPD